MTRLAMALLAVCAVAVGQRPEWKIWTPGNTGTQGDYSFAVLVDSAGRLWAHGYQPNWDQGGMVMYDGQRWYNWSTVDSLCPDEDLRSFKQDAAGNIWMGSKAGLLKFDGVGFTAYNRSTVPGFPCDTVQDVDIDTAGNVWLAMENFNGNNGGIGRFDGTNWTFWKRGQGHPFPAPWNPVRAIACAPNGDIWAGASSVGLARFSGGTWTYFDTLAHQVDDILIDSTGVVWIAQTYLISYDNGTWRDHGSSGSLPVLGLAPRSEGGLWVGCPNGLFSYHNGAWTNQNWPGGFAYLAAESPDGSLWACGIGGVAQRVGGNWQLYNISRTGLNDYWLYGIGFDSRRTVWMCGGYGISTFDREAWRNFNRYGGTQPWPYPTDILNAAVEGPDGKMWIATYAEGVVVWDGTDWVAQYIDGEVIGDVIRDSTGVMWAYEDFSTRGLYRIDNGVVRKFDYTNSPITSYVQGICADVGGYVWVATLNELIRTDGTNWEVYDTLTSGMPGTGRCWSPARSPDGTLWLSVDLTDWNPASGLARFDRRDTTWTLYDSTNSPVAAAGISAVDGNGVLWHGFFRGDVFPYRGALLRFDGTDWTRYDRDNSPLPHEQIYDIAIDWDNNPWVSCASEGVAEIRWYPTGMAEPGTRVAAPARLNAFPNPFRGSTTIRLGSPRAGNGSLAIVDAAGRTVRALSFAAGAASVTWDGRDGAGRRVSPGVYFARVGAESRRLVCVE
jgi:hypothetical protein